MECLRLLLHRGRSIPFDGFLNVPLHPIPIPVGMTHLGLRIGLALTGISQKRFHLRRDILFSQARPLVGLSSLDEGRPPLQKACDEGDG